MYRRSLIALARQGGRTIVRDPRKKRLPAVRVVNDDKAKDENQTPSVYQSSSPGKPLPFGPSSQSQESVGSSLASYALAGVGVSLGFILVRVVTGL